MSSTPHTALAVVGGQGAHARRPRVGVGFGVRPDGVALVEHALHQLRVLADASSDDEERRPDPSRSELVEDPRRVDGVWAVVERQRHGRRRGVEPALGAGSSDQRSPRAVRDGTRREDHAGRQPTTIASARGWSMVRCRPSRSSILSFQPGIWRASQNYRLRMFMAAVLRFTATGRRMTRATTVQ